MKLNIVSICTPFLLGLLLLVSCGKDNVDMTSIDGGDVDPIVTTCDLEVDLTQNPINTLVATVTGGTAPFTYAWSTGEPTPQIDISMDGTYSVSVTDAEGCIVSESIVVDSTDPCNGFSLTVEQTAAGILFAVTTGGTAPYSYLWSTGETTESIAPNAPGDFTVEVTDAEGCVLSDVFTIPCGGLILNIMETNPGTINVTVTGGTPPYTYLWSTGEVTSTISVTMGGTYQLEVTDANGCTAAGEITVTGPDPCNGFSTILTEQPPGSGDIYTSTTGGTQPYLYQWSTGELTPDISVTMDGTYEVTITDATGCVIVETITILMNDPCNGLTTTIEQTATGSLGAMTTGGTQPYAYLWSTGETTSMIVVNTGGTYSVTVTDAQGCTVTDEIIL